MKKIQRNLEKIVEVFKDIFSPLFITLHLHWHSALILVNSLRLESLTKCLAFLLFRIKPTLSAIIQLCLKVTFCNRAYSFFMFDLIPLLNLNSSPFSPVPHMDTLINPGALPFGTNGSFKPLQSPFCAGEPLHDPTIKTPTKSPFLAVLSHFWITWEVCSVLRDPHYINHKTFHRFFWNVWPYQSWHLNQILGGVPLCS